MFNCGEKKGVSCRILCNPVCVGWYVSPPQTQEYLAYESLRTRGLLSQDWSGSKTCDLIDYYGLLQEYLLDPKDLHHAEVSLFCVGIFI
jgi:hypothetical protein